MTKRLPNRENRPNRDSGGRFISGCRPGPGNPFGGHVARLRGELLRAVTPSDMQAVIGKLLKAAKAGKPWAVREFLDRTLGRSMTTLELAAADRSEGERPSRIVICVSPESGRMMQAKGYDVKQLDVSE